MCKEWFSSVPTVLKCAQAGLGRQAGIPQPGSQGPSDYKAALILSDGKVALGEAPQREEGPDSDVWRAEQVAPRAEGPDS